MSNYRGQHKSHTGNIYIPHFMLWVVINDNITEVDLFKGQIKDLGLIHYILSRIMRKPDFCICENKDADQLPGNHKADQHLCFRYSGSTITLIPKSEIPSL